MSARWLLPSVFVLAATACAPGNDEGDGGAPAVPPGFELASAKQAAPGLTGTVVPAMRVIDLSVAELRTRLERGNVRLIDVRTDEEVAKGMISGAEHIALDRFDPATLDLSDGREVILYCRSGRRSAIAAERLAAQTGKPSVHLAGGILAWRSADRLAE